jgi:predicted extracellular nuclease
MIMIDSRTIAMLATAALAMAAGSAHAALIISEVDPAGSSNGAGYLADWFELTNTGASAINITGWKMDDNSNSFAAAVALNLAGSSIAAGQSVIFIETTVANLPTTRTSFVNTWFGGSAPAGFTMGSYSGSGVGLSTTAGDAVNIFDSTGVLQANVQFGAIADLTKTLDNTQGLNNTTISQASAVGVNGAFAGTDGRVGSPATFVPVPAAAWLFSGALGLLGAMRRRTA